MWGIGCIFVSCVLFIHLGLGDAVSRVLDIRCILLKCVKCLTFWSVLAYSLCLSLPVEVCLCVAFACAYASLWAELLLGKIACKYEEWNESMDAEEPETGSRNRIEETETGKGQESPMPRL